MWRDRPGGRGRRVKIRPGICLGQKNVDGVMVRIGESFAMELPKHISQKKQGAN